MPSPQHTRKSWLPHPLLSVVMLFIWLSLQDFSIGQLLLGIALALAIPYWVQDFWPQQVKIHKPFKLMAFMLLLLYDICVANIKVAIQILGPTKALHEAYFWVPLDLEDEFLISLLASAITMTPGTVSADFSQDRKYIYIHGLNVHDIDAEIALIKQRYEAPIKEIFLCST